MAVAQPTSLEETVAELSAQPDALLLGGGTDLMVEVNAGTRRLDHVVSLRRVRELRGWHVEGRDLVLGAATTYTDLLAPEHAAL
jgi:xanthine dehydrogenase small subunit